MSLVGNSPPHTKQARVAEDAGGDVSVSSMSC